MLLLIDNYDSFTYNIYDYFRQLNQHIVLIKNDEYSLDDITAMRPEGIILSPGPSDPNHAGITLSAIHHFAGKVPILGICLGHQAIAQAFGAKIIKANAPTHGKTALITHDKKTLFRNLPNPLRVARYHSLMVDKDSLPRDFIVSAYNQTGIIMAIRHRQLAIEGVQFHPEAIQTECGLALFANFIDSYLA